MKKDVVVVDPDELREAHPKFGEFRRAHPYTWSGLTHADASQWADELLDATVSAKKNLIFDTTLSNGEWAAGFVKDLELTHHLNQEHHRRFRSAFRSGASPHGEGKS
jgi:hypothetical protein